MPFTSRTPTYLTPEQRHALTQIPADLSDREIARHYTFTQKDLDLIKSRRRLHNRLGFAVLRFPGRPLKDLAGIPSRVLAALLGFRFAPRISDALSKKLYLLDEVGESGPLGTLAFGQVNRKLIMEQWDEMRRVASSIRHGTVSASLLMRKLAAYPRQNQVARALTELGNLERTAFLLEYFRDESLRRSRAEIVRRLWKEGSGETRANRYSHLFLRGQPRWPTGQLLATTPGTGTSARDRAGALPPA